MSQLSMVKLGTSVQPKTWLGMDDGVGRTQLFRRQDGFVVIVCAHSVDGTLAFSLGYCLCSPSGWHASFQSGLLFVLTQWMAR